MQQNSLLSQATEYLKNRLSAEISFQNNLETIIYDYAGKLVDIAYQANISPDVFTFNNKSIKEKVDALISEMEQLIITITETLAVADHKKDKVVSYMNSNVYGENFYDRLDNHVNTFKKEMEGIIASGLLIGTSKIDIKQSIKTFRNMPYQNKIFKDAVKLNKGRAEVLVSKGLHSSVGVSNSAFNSINTLGRYTISDIWMKNWYDEWDGKGAIGYNVKRGSSYPCSLCDSNVGFHTDDNLPPYHPSCCCIAIPVFDK